MSKVVKLESRHPAVSKKTAAPAPTRRRTASECPVYTPPSDDAMLDHMLHAQIAKLTGGMSPIALALAGLDWSAHLMSSPAKMQKLHQVIKVQKVIM